MRAEHMDSFAVLRIFVNSPAVHASTLFKVSLLSKEAYAVAQDGWFFMQKRFPEVPVLASGNPDPWIPAKEVHRRLGLTPNDCLALSRHLYFGLSHARRTEAWWHACAKWGGPLRVKARKTFPTIKQRRMQQLSRLHVDNYLPEEYTMCVEPFVRNGKGGAKECKRKLERYRHFLTHAPDLANAALGPFVDGSWTWQQVLDHANEVQAVNKRRYEAVVVGRRVVRDLFGFDIEQASEACVACDPVVSAYIQDGTGSIDENSLARTILLWKMFPWNRRAIQVNLWDEDMNALAEQKYAKWRAGLVKLPGTPSFASVANRVDTLANRVDTLAMVQSPGVL